MDGVLECFGNIKQILAFPYQVSAKCTTFSLTFVLLIAWKILRQNVVSLSTQFLVSITGSDDGGREGTLNY